MVEVGNIYYFGVIGLIVLGLVGIYKYLKNKSYEKQRKFLIIWAFHLFALQYLRQLVYLNLRDLHCSTMENICTLSSLIFPFLLLIKKRTILNDWMFFIGVLGGGLAILYPTDAIGVNLITFEPFFFYFCHGTLLGIPLIMVSLGMFKPDIKKIWAIPLIFLGYQAIIFVNDFIVCYTRLYWLRDLTPDYLFWSRVYMNHSFTFGPIPDFPVLTPLFDFLCPSIFKIDYFGIADGGVFYFPVLWLIVPSFILLPPIYALLTCPFWIKDLIRKNKKI